MNFLSFDLPSTGKRGTVLGVLGSVGAILIFSSTRHTNIFVKTLKMYLHHIYTTKLDLSTWFISLTSNLFLCTVRVTLPIMDSLVLLLSFPHHVNSWIGLWRETGIWNTSVKMSWCLVRWRNNFGDRTIIWELGNDIAFLRLNIIKLYRSYCWDKGLLSVKEPINNPGQCGLLYL